MKKGGIGDMKKSKFLIVIALIIVLFITLCGCSKDSLVQSLTTNYFSNTYEKAIPQTNIANYITSHIGSVGNSQKKKALLITIDGMRAESLNYIMDSDLGLSQISKDGGLYWTTPANLKTKANIDIGVNFLSIVTGREPSTFDVLKNTDAKRESPYSIMFKESIQKNVKFLTDNENYVHVQLAAELKSKKPNKLTSATSLSLNALRKDCLNSLSTNDFVAVAISAPYNKAKGNYKMSNQDYLSTLIDLSYYIADIYKEIKNRMTNDKEDWLVVVATTCGGKSKMATYRQTDNTLTFMATNKPLVG